MGVICVLIDTNAYTAATQGQNGAAEVIQKSDIIGINSVVLGELQAGFAAGSRNEYNQQELQRFLATPRVKILSIDQQTTEFYAQIYLQLRQAGKPIPTNDMWIAASALQHSLALFTYDKHFQNIKNLTVGNHIDDFDIS